MKLTKYISLLGLAIIFWHCEPSFDEFKPSNGDANFSTFVSIGDSYSAGYTDGALSAFGQNNSFVAMMALQFKTVGGGEFKQPMIPEGKSIGSSGNSSYVLQVSNGTLKPISGNGNVELLSTPSNWINAQAPFNNVAVPGAKSFHLLTPLFGDYTLGSGNFNPFYTRFASNPGVSTVFGDGMLKTPTFVSLWIGGNDVLAYALAGGEGGTGTGANDITDATTFTSSIQYMFGTLKAAGIKGVTANIPGIDALPYFNTVPYNGLVLTADQATALNSAYAGYNTTAASNGWPLIAFAAGPNGFVVEDKLGFLRHATSTDKILLEALTLIQTQGWGSQTKIPKNKVLDAAEINNIKAATTNFNTILKAQAETNGLAFVDLESLMNQVKAGLIIDGTKYTTAFVSGNVFSLDGIHATARGSAIIANGFIKAINVKYGADVPFVNVNDYQTVIFP